MAKLVDGNKKVLALASAGLLALVPWMQISRAVSANVRVGAGELAAVTAAGVAVHLAYLAFNNAAVRLLRIGGAPGPECAAPLPYLQTLSFSTPLLSRDCLCAVGMSPCRTYRWP
jgi:hypothetical protein